MSAPGIRFVCVSDLHLGDKDSILTLPRESDEESPRPGPVLEQLVRCLGTLADPDDRPTLIVNGDFLDLAFGKVSDALMMFERSAALLQERPIFDRFVYLPGNHDHHLWEVARGTQYRETVLREHHADGLPPMAHSTPPSLEGTVPAALLNDMLRHLGPETNGPGFRNVEVVYPNLVLHHPGRDRAVVIHHGHFVEPLYRLFSRGRRWLFPERPPASTVDDIEGENFAWIEFVWSLLGRSAGAGRDVENLFEMLRYPQRVKDFTAALARRTAPTLRVPLVPFVAARRFVLRMVFERLAGALSGERTNHDEIHSAKLMQGLSDYLYGPTFHQVEEHLGHVPRHVTFVFGHTHKPFEQTLRDDENGRVDTLNSGGWTVDTDRPLPRFGASIVLIDDELDTVALRVYNDAPDGGPDSLCVHAASPHDGHLAARVRQRLAEPAVQREWKALRAGVLEAVGAVRDRHRERFGR